MNNATTTQTTPVTSDRERISKFFFGSTDMGWDAIISTYNGIETQYKSGYQFERAAASDILAELDDDDKRIILERQELNNLE